MGQTRYLIILLLTVLCSCNKKSENTDITQKQITVLFSPGGVGDMGYNDQILRGVLQSRDEKKFKLQVASTNSLEEGEKIFVDWLNKDTDTPSLFILAANEYEDMAVRHLSTGKYPGKEILLFETRNHDIPQVSTFSITMYGACYLAGCIATLFTDRAAVICASSADKAVNEGGVGFSKGFLDNGGKEAPLFYLSDTWKGYSMPEVAYKKAAELAPDYKYIFPIAGGSNMGIYRYSREYPEDFYTAGMDVDQSQLSTQITLSVVKYIELLIEDYINQWLSGQPLPKNKVYGMQSGYIGIKLSNNYKNTCQNKLEELRDTAIKKEEEHEKEYK